MPFKTSPSSAPSSVKPEDLFVCRRCGDCCKGYGGTFVTPDDIMRIALFIGASPETFVETYCRMSGGRPVIAQKADSYCIFWDEEKMCLIHPVKPRMCRDWPFIESVARDPANWEIMSGVCPGIRTDYPPEVVRACVAGVVAARNAGGAGKGGAA